MQQVEQHAGFLLDLAAAAIAPAIRGCAGTLSRTKSGAKNSRTPPRAIEYFGPLIVETWKTALQEQDNIEQQETLVQLATMPAPECRRRAEKAVAEAAAEADPKDRAVAVEYLVALPLTVSRSLIPVAKTGRKTLPPYLACDDEKSLAHLLPTDVPPFPIGSDVAGTSYYLEQLLGMGGFGAVYRARHRFEQNQPPRAIKFCLDASMGPTLHRERVILDRLMAVAGSTWSNRVVRLYGYALDFDPPFLVYEYVPGGDLTSYLTATQQQTGRGFAPALAMQLVRQIAEGLAFAHRQGLVHRDLKPANVLVSGQTIKLTDFGIGGVSSTLAVRSTTMTAATAAYVSVAGQGQFFRGSGTPLYMSPEQRRGDQPDPRHDLYSLGVLWYQLLVGDVARELHPGWPDELIEEFQTPEEHIELIRHCVGYFKKRPPHAGELLALMRGGPTPARPTATATAVPTGGAVLLTPRTEPEPLKPLEKMKHTLMEQIDRDALREAQATVAAILRLDPTDPEALEAQSFLQQRLKAEPAEVHRFEDHTGWVRTVAISAGGRLAVSGGDDASVRLWDLKAQREMRRFEGHSGAVMSVGFAPDGRWVVSGGWDGSVRLWELASGREFGRIKRGWQSVKSVALSPDGKFVAFGTDDSLVRLWDLAGARELRCFEGHKEIVQSLVFMPDGRQLVSGSDDAAIRLWEVESGKEAAVFNGHEAAVTSVDIARDGRHILSGSSDRTARLWNLSGKERCRFEGHETFVNAVGFSPDGKFAVTGSGGALKDGEFCDGGDTTVRIWDLKGTELGRLEGHKASVTAVVVAPDGKHILSGSLDQTVRLWNLPGGVEALR
jgi:WD40 repeat protein